MQKHLCTVCGIPIAAHESTCKTCLKNPPNFDATFYIDSYDGVLQTAMHALKYQKRLACATGFAYLWNLRVMEIAGSAIASSVTYLTPVVAVIVGIIFLGESITWNEPVGALVVLLGAAIAQERIAFKR